MDYNKNSQTSYYLLYSQDGVYFAFYFERNTRKVGFISVYSYTAVNQSRWKILL